MEISAPCLCGQSCPRPLALFQLKFEVRQGLKDRQGRPAGEGKAVRVKNWWEGYLPVAEMGKVRRIQKEWLSNFRSTNF